jgi:DNA-binding winged helix-turn-helix (wHTH) protein/TolB-like protein/Tfp pilus assembly protein PilF
MTNNHKSTLFYTFGPFRLDITKRLLLRDGTPIHLVPKAFDTLLVLVESHGGVIGKTELIERVWPDSFVEEINLTVYISMLRKILGDSPDEHQYIVTSPRRGYSFVAPVIEEIGEDDSSTIDLLRVNGKPARSMLIVAEENNDKVRLPPVEQKIISEITKSYWSGYSTAIRQNGLLYKIPFIILLIGIMVALSWFFIFRKPVPEPGAQINQSIAVLPFKVLGEHQEVNLELGMADALIMRLSRLEQIVVRPSNVIFAYAGKNYDPIVAGRELGVGAVMLGNVQQTDNRIRVSVQLINIADGKTLWADRFDEERINIFSIQDSISERVAQALALKLNNKQIEQSAKSYTNSVEAYKTYSRGLYFWSLRSDEALKKSIDYFQQAIAIDPNYALAYAGIADSAILLSGRSASEQLMKEYGEKARTAALKAIEIDETVAEAHTALALVKWGIDSDSVEAEREYKRALELNPKYATGHQRYAWFLLNSGQLNRAVPEMQLAAELEPLSRVNNVAWANFLYFLGEHDKAIEQCTKILEIAPEFETASFFRGLAYEQKQQYEQAIKDIEKYGEKNKDDPIVYGALGHIYGVCGRTKEAYRMIRELERLGKKDHSSIYCVGLVYLGLGDKDLAFIWLEKGARAKAPTALGFRYDPRFAVIREDPRYKTFMQLLQGMFAR